MSYTETENLKLRKDNGDEKIVDWRTHSNANMDTIDEAVQNLVEVCANAKSLLGQLGLDESGHPLIDAASARTTLGAATSGGASNTLYTAEQSIATNAGNIATNASNISKNASDITALKNSVSLVSPLSKVEFDQWTADRYGAISFAGPYGTFTVIFDTAGISIWDRSQGVTVKYIEWS